MTCFTIVPKNIVNSTRNKTKEDAFDNVMLELSFLRLAGERIHVLQPNVQKPEKFSFFPVA